MYAKYNPVDKFYKSAIGGAKLKEKITFTVVSDSKEVNMLIRPDCGKYTVFRMKKAGNRFTFEYTPKKAGLFFYCFNIDGVRFGMPENGYASKDFSQMGEGGEEYQLTVYSPDYVTPDWLKGGIIYQIFPDRFNKVGDIKPRKCQRLRVDWGGQPEFLPVNGKVLNDDFFGGNIKGIINKLDYLHSLGVTAIYLNPIFMARSNHRYDTGDYMQVDTLLGGESDLKELFDKAKKLGIGIILDGVFNHTGDDSKFFNKYNNYNTVGAYNSKDSEYADWYSFTKFPDKYESWWGIDILPQTNENSPSFREYICGINGVLRHYLRLGASGWRLDVVDELPSSFVKEIRSAVKAEKSDAVIIGEVWENVTDKIAYGIRREYFQGAELDSAMNYPLKNAIINYIITENTSELVSVIRRQTDNYPPQSLNCIMNILGTHDTPRIINVLSGAKYPGDRFKQAEANLETWQYERGVNLLKIASAIEFTIYGVPTIYYGDELGMYGWADPFNRGCMEWGRNSILSAWYAKLGQIRRKFHVFSDGETKIEFCTRGAMVFSRSCKDQKIYTAVNLGAHTLTFDFTEEVENLLNGRIGRSITLGYGDVAIVQEKI